MNNSIYTNADWGRDGTFKAIAGQEIAEDIYDNMLNSVSPLTLPRSKDITFECGFRNGEPYTSGEAKNGTYVNYFAAFGKLYGKCYYLGLMNKYGEVLEKTV